MEFNKLLDSLSVLKECGAFFAIKGETNFEKEANIVRAVAKLNGINLISPASDIGKAISITKKKGVVRAASPVKFDDKCQQILIDSVDVCDIFDIPDDMV